MKKRYLFYLLWIPVALFWVSPLLISILTALKSLDDLLLAPAWSLPSYWHIDNFATAWTIGHLGRYILNSFVIAGPAVVGTLFLSSLSAFALSYYRFKAAGVILMIFVGGMLLPFQMLMIPVYRFSISVGIYNTYLGVILFHVSFQLGFCTFFLRSFMKTLPRSLFEAAKVDGASDVLLYARIVLPLIRPALAALSILEFTWIWNDYLWALVLIQSDKIKPVTLGLTVLQGEYIAQWNVIAAGALLAAIPPIIVFLIFQRHFIDGLTMGALKG